MHSVPYFSYFPSPLIAGPIPSRANGLLLLQVMIPTRPYRTGASPMTTIEFGEALSRLVGEAEDAGLELEKILAEIEGIASMEVVVA